MRKTLLALTLLTGLPAAAADAGMPPAMSDVTVTSAPASLWRGHFSGGRNLNPRAEQIALDWKDEVAFFADDLTCRRWIRGLRAEYANYQGFSGCLRIR